MNTQNILKMVGVGSLLMLTACGNTPSLSADAKTVYLNEELGFAVSGYSYSQDGLVCDIDNYLVSSLVAEAVNHDINLVPINGSATIKSKQNILAIDINELVLGQNKKNFVGNSAVDPKIGVMAGYINKSLAEPLISTSYSCVAFTDKMAFSNYAGRASNCSSLHKCARRLSNDVIGWLSAQLK